MRYKEYNRNKVLEQSLAVFWQKGFNGCSVNELVEITGVNRFSLYSEFENKEGILYASLELYKERYCQDKLSILDSNDDLHVTLKKFYSSFLEDDTFVSGCYYIHLGTELADSDERIRAGLDSYLNEIENRFKELLVRKGLNENPNHDAKHLLGLFCTVMSFCLIHTPKQRENYITNGIHLILSKYGQSIK